MKELRFVTDGMLGKLTRWLRMLGHNVEYARSIDDKALIQKAKKENRILLTRDIELYRQAVGKGAETFLTENPDQTANLAQLAKRYGFELEINVKTSRCPKCNGKIKIIPKALVADKIPKTTSLNYEEFWQCQNCAQIYWHGAHWKRIERTLTEAEKALKTLKA
jgi:hypothetical protein